MALDQNSLIQGSIAAGICILAGGIQMQKPKLRTPILILGFIIPQCSWWLATYNLLKPKINSRAWALGLSILLTAALCIGCFFYMQGFITSPNPLAIAAIIALTYVVPLSFGIAKYRK